MKSFKTVIYDFPVKKVSDPFAPLPKKIVSSTIDGMASLSVSETKKARILYPTRNRETGSSETEGKKREESGDWGSDQDPGKDGGEDEDS